MKKIKYSQIFPKKINLNNYAPDVPYSYNYMYNIDVISKQRLIGKRKYYEPKEILDNYEESQSTLNKKNKVKKNNKKDEEEFNKLIKKKNSLIHLRNTKKNNYNQEIKKQVKYIEQLKNTINEVNHILTSME